MAWQQNLAKHQNLVKTIKIHSKSQTETGMILMTVDAEGQVWSFVDYKEAIADRQWLPLVTNIDHQSHQGEGGPRFHWGVTVNQSDPGDVIGSTTQPD